jgi:hypothetical protein
MPSADKEALTIEPWAAGIGLGTLLLVGLVAVYAAWDRTRTASIEQVITITAVGDPHLVKAPVNGKGEIGLKYQGRKLDMVADDKLRDSKLIQYANDDSGVYWLYRLVDDEGAPVDDRLYMKVAPNDFIEVKQE